MIQNEKYTIEKLRKQVACPVELALRVLGGKWRGSILYQLKDEGLRFNELKNRVQNAVYDYEGADNFLSNKVLSNHLKELIIFGLIQKNEKTEKNSSYELTIKGVSSIPVLLQLFYWGENHL
jgi:DNA-binding HxlR family transcriptional regulator